MTAIGLWTPAEIRALRLAHRQTQRQFAAHIGVGEVTWCRWETGKQRPRIPYIQILDRALELAAPEVHDRVLEILAQWSEGAPDGGPARSRAVPLE